MIHNALIINQLLSTSDMVKSINLLSYQPSLGQHLVHVTDCWLTQMGTLYLYCGVTQFSNAFVSEGNLTSKTSMYHIMSPDCIITSLNWCRKFVCITSVLCMQIKLDECHNLAPCPNRLNGNSFYNNLLLLEEMSSEVGNMFQSKRYITIFLNHFSVIAPLELIHQLVSYCQKMAVTAGKVLITSLVVNV